MCYGCYFNDFQQEESGEKEYSSRENGSDWVWGLLGIKFEKKKYNQSNFILGKLLIVSIIQR